MEIVLLCLSIVLLTTPPPSSEEDEENSFTNLYLHTKTSIVSAEVLGINSFLIIQSRILVTLFEVAHGFYPAAYISIGATVRAADALEVHPLVGGLHNHYSDEQRREHTVLIWCGILILDR